MNLSHIYKIVTCILIAAFVMTSLYVPKIEASEIVLPKPGTMVSLSPAFTPAIVRGMTIDVKNPFAFTFLIDRGDNPIAQEQKKAAYEKLIKYFLAAMTIPEDKQWVNLSPYEKNRIIDNDFGKTEMGRDLLAQDYMLKQITASLFYPEGAIGKEFWKRVYKEAAEKFGTITIPINTFNKVWITPDKASVYEKGRTVLIVESKLKVQLEEDYWAAQKNSMSSPNVFVGDLVHANGLDGRQKPSGMTSSIIRQIIIPALTKEVNEGKNFANLRQMYQGMILATWYKQALKKSILNQVYANKSKVQGLNLANPEKAQQEVYQQYVKAFKQGVYNFIKEDQDPSTGQMIPRKYFSGGFVDTLGINGVTNASFAMASEMYGKTIMNRIDAAQTVVVSPRSDAAMNSIGKHGI